jgi:hypothetical protein
MTSGPFGSVRGFDGAACAATTTLKRHETVFVGSFFVALYRVGGFTMTFHLSRRESSSQDYFSCRCASAATGACRCMADRIIARPALIDRGANTCQWQEIFHVGQLHH